MQESYAVFRESDEADRRDDARRHAWLTDQVCALEPKLRETALLVLGEDLSHAEAAAALGLRRKHGVLAHA